MDFVRALKFAFVIGVVVAGIWLFREDHLCKGEIERQIGPTALVEHPIGSQWYNVVPKTRASSWKSGDPYPVVVTCWTDFGGVSNFSRH